MLNGLKSLSGEELSSNADAVLAVSSSGFTEGAILKAKKYGIVTRDFISLTEEEIRRWGNVSEIVLNYVKFINPKLILRLKYKSKNVVNKKR